MNRLHSTRISNVYLVMVRLWLGYSMIMGGKSILHFFNPEYRDFFQNWFGKELGLPAPLLLAFLDKGIEFTGGILVCVGLLTRISASCIALVMLAATLIANLNYHGGNESIIRQDGLATISCFLFAFLLVLSGGGRYSLDNFIFRKRSALT